MPRPGSSPLPPCVRRSALTLLAAAWVALLVQAVIGTVHPLSGLLHDGAVDLRIYRDGALTVVHGSSLYNPTWEGGLHFTYPPFAALVFLSLVPGGLPCDVILLTAGSCLALVWCLRRAALLDGRRPRIRVLVPLALLLVPCEPATYTLSFGQINLLLAALVITDLSLPDSCRLRGAMVGIAAGLKLTPLIFIPYLFFSGSRRAALRALAVFAGTVALAALLTPDDASSFWLHGLFLSSSRVGGTLSVANQSLAAALRRLSPGLAGAVLPLDAVIMVTGLWTACLVSRRGDRLLGFTLTALTGLLISPVSWVHHWVLVLPALPYLALRRSQARLPGISGQTRLPAVSFYLLTLSYWLLTVYQHHHPAPMPRTPLAQLADGAYVWAGLLTLLSAGAVQLRYALRARNPGLVAPNAAPDAARSPGLVAPARTAARAVHLPPEPAVLPLPDLRTNEPLAAGRQRSVVSSLLD